MRIEEFWDLGIKALGNLGIDESGEKLENREE